MRKNNVSEITDLLRFLPKVEIFGGKALEVDDLSSYVDHPNIHSKLEYKMIRKNKFENIS